MTLLQEKCSNTRSAGRHANMRHTDRRCVSGSQTDNVQKQTPSYKRCLFFYASSFNEFYDIIGLILKLKGEENV